MDGEQNSTQPGTTEAKPVRRTRRRSGVAIDRGLQLHLVLHAQLGGATEKLVLMILLDYYGQNSRCCPSHATIAACANLTRRSVIRTIQRLAETGVIRVVGRVDEAGDQTSNEYHFNWDRLEALQPSAEDQPAPSGGDTVSPPQPPTGPDQQPNQGSDTESPPSDGETPPVVTVGHQGGDTVSHEPPIEPPNWNRPPQPPAERGEPTPGQGGGDEARSADSPPEPTLDQWIERIVRAYPSPPGGSVSGLDREAVRSGLLAESLTSTGCSPAEIEWAAQRVAAEHRSGRLKSPLWLRTWMKRRGFADLVHREREAKLANHRALTRQIDTREQARLEREALERERRETAEIIGSLSDAQLDHYRERVISLWEQRGSTWLRITPASEWRTRDPRRGAMAGEISDLVKRDRAANREHHHQEAA